MKINPSDVKVPLKKTVEVKKGIVEVSLSKRDEQTSQAYQEFVTSYVASIDQATLAEAAAQFVAHEDAILETSESAELTPAQKKLPPNIQKALLEKMNKKKAKAQMEEEEDDEMEDEMKDECEDGEGGKPCGKDSCAKCSSKASS